MLEVADTRLTEVYPVPSHTQLLWHHVPIDGHVAFHPEAITVEEVLGASNAELRWVLCERMGYERFIHEADAQEIDLIENVSGVKRLLRIKVTDNEPFVGLVMTGPPPKRQYLFRVPPNMETCQQASAWVGGLDNPREYLCPS